MKRIEMDDRISLAHQLSSGEAPALLITVFHVAPEHTDALLAAWAADAAVRKRRAGFISTQLHRGIAGSGTLIDHTVWESVQAVRRAHVDPALQLGAARYPRSTTSSQHLFEPIAVPGICVGTNGTPEPRRHPGTNSAET